MKSFALSIICILSVSAFGQSESTTVFASDKGSKMTYKNSDGFNSFKIEVRGTIEVSDDDRDIKSMSADGYLEITKTTFGSKRTIKISAQGNTIKREYFEGRSPVTYEPEGRKWLSEILPEVVRTTTVAAESRVNRFYRKGGVQAVLTEINVLEGDYLKAHYANLLMKLPVQVKDYATIITKVSIDLDSDHYLTEFLDNNLSKFMKSNESINALFTATNKMESDHYKTQVITAALRVQPVSLESVKLIMASVSKMESDHYKTEVLTTVMRHPNLTDPILAEMVNVSKTIESDHYRTIVLTNALERNLSASSYQLVIESVKGIESDHYKTQVIKSMLVKPLDSQVLSNLLSITSSIESDHYRSEVLTDLLKKKDLKEEDFKKLVEYCTTMDSDHYKSQVLQAALSTPQLTDGKLIAVINAAAQIDSDHYITEVLVDAAPEVKSASASVKDAYRAAARNIDSETYYGRSLRAIEN
jgi:hypothetical protein